MQDDTAPVIAISLIAFSTEGPMDSKPLLTHEQLQREMDYRVALGIAKQLCQQGLVSHGELRKIEQKLRKNFSPVWGAIADNSRL